MKRACSLELWTIYSSFPQNIIFLIQSVTLFYSVLSTGFQKENFLGHLPIAFLRYDLYCYSHGKSLPSNAGLMVGKRVLQGEAWSDLSDSRGTHDLGDKLGDHFGDLATNRLFSKMQPFSRYFY
ncbi:hypothetical protein AVEN_164754-1 [Araneus ventricosus]|uniref:Uncharacterized protein n=1 Tax=Araneus ventricosus TaxID=182803 RepID=A0A4Y2V803_ARAVE|nr:hypothetical protein AVEN_253344-1 [Araneus ventricosus]GBO20678.1 hypothetical protein AVEN_164754-1 [Araneus ventricosus]